MKYVFLFFFINLSISEVAAQSINLSIPRDAGKKRSIDDCRIAITYRVKISTDTINKDWYYDNQILEIGEKYTRYYSFFAEDIDSVLWNARNEKSTIDGAVATKKNLSDTEDATYDDLFFDYPLYGDLTVITRIVNTDYQYIEPIPKIGWLIDWQTKTILGYKCQRATAVYGKRKWDAWFATEIPIQKGPYKFGGLPGLILQIEDSKKLFVYEAIGVEQPKNRLIYKYDISSVKTTRNNVAKLEKMRWQDPITLLQTHGMKVSQPRTLNPTTGQLDILENWTVPYIPTIELE